MKQPWLVHSGASQVTIKYLEMENKLFIYKNLPFPLFNWEKLISTANPLPNSCDVH